MPRPTPLDNPHLTAKQREALLELFDQCDTAEFLRCVAGLVQRRVAEAGRDHYDAGSAILAVARAVSGIERAAWTIAPDRAAGPVAAYYAISPDGARHGPFPHLSAARRACPGATVCQSRR